MTEIMTSGPRKSDRFIPWYFVAFFLVVALVDGVFVYMATSTHTGVVSDHAYEEGLAYNTTIAEAEKQEKLGWQGHVDLTIDGLISFSLRDQHGQPVTGGAARVALSWAADNARSVDLSLAESASGEYHATAEALTPGLWDIRVYVTRNGQAYQQHERLVIR